VFLIDPDRAWTYGEFDDEVNRIAAARVAQALQPGDRIIVQLRKGVREVAAMLAASKVGLWSSTSTPHGPRNNSLM
jgi:acyl-coenzyme A synthetase/AMP-(fatty) acid ligase